MRLLAKPLTLLAVIVLAISVTAAGQPPAPSDAPATYPIDSNNYTDANQFAFLSGTLKDVEAVSLGESIHMTHEFPLVRLGIIRYLNENMGFHVLAMEGSAADLWVAQDRFLNSMHTSDDAKDAQGGLFMLWNTPEVRQVFEYEAATWSSANPFYVTAYDIQPGNGHRSHGTEVFRLLVERLKGYVPVPNGFDVTQWMADISPLVTNCDQFQSSDQLRADKAIQVLQQWIETAAPEAQKRFPRVPHAIAMSLIPENLRARWQLCVDWSADPRHDLGSHRDPIAAQYALELKAAIPGQKVMLWAHINHLFHDVEHYHVSTGEVLHRALGTRLYTIGVFPESGGAIVIFEGKDNEDLGYTRIHSDRGGLAERLSHLSAQNYFLDFRQTGISAGNDPVFVTSQPMRFEGRSLPLAVARDFDGIIWIKTIHAPDLPIVLLLAFSCIHYIPELIAVGAVLICGIAFLIIRGIRWRRRKRAA